jgi:hypothetical protein
MKIIQAGQSIDGGRLTAMRLLPSAVAVACPKMTFKCQERTHCPVLSV